MVRRLPLPVAWLTLGWAFAAGCPAPGFELVSERARELTATPLEAGRRTHGAQPIRALAPPELRVVPSEAFAAGPVSGRVSFHGPAGSGEQRLLLSSATGPTVALFYRVSGGFALPVEVGESVTIAWSAAEPAGRSGWALTVRGAGDAVRAVVYSARGREPVDGDWGLLAVELPAGVEVRPHRGIVYSELRRLASLCLAMIEHRQVRVNVRGTFHYLKPGTYRRFALDDGAFRLLVLDASMLVDERCADSNPTHFSFALLAAPEVEVAPSDPAATASGGPPSATGPTPAATR